MNNIKSALLTLLISLPSYAEVESISEQVSNKKNQLSCLIQVSKINKAIPMDRQEVDYRGMYYYYLGKYNQGVKLTASEINSVTMSIPEGGDIPAMVSGYENSNCQ